MSETLKKLIEYLTSFLFFFQLNPWKIIFSGTKTWDLSGRKWMASRLNITKRYDRIGWRSTNDSSSQRVRLLCPRSLETLFTAINPWRIKIGESCTSLQQSLLEMKQTAVALQRSACNITLLSMSINSAFLILFMCASVCILQHSCKCQKILICFWFCVSVFADARICIHARIYTWFIRCSIKCIHDRLCCDGRDLVFFATLSDTCSDTR